MPVFSYQHPNDGQHVCMAGPRLQADCHVSSSGVYDALSQNGAELSHHVVVLVSDHLIGKTKELSTRLSHNSLMIVY